MDTTAADRKGQMQRGAVKAEDQPAARPLVATSLVALGIVYGDIGTSPLYAFRESLLGHALAAPAMSSVFCR